MRGPFDDLEDDAGIVWRDVILLALAGFMMLVLLLLPHLNPPTKKADDIAPGNIVIEVRWPDNLPADVDLWVKAPGDRPVGYSNSSGTVFNLLRDDLGHTNDLGGLNMEQAYSRGAPDGEYIVNLHLFHAQAAHLPVPVRVEVSYRADIKSTLSTIVTADVDLAHVGAEETVVRFEMHKGRLVPGSVNQIPYPLRRAHGGV